MPTQCRHNVYITKSTGVIHQANDIVPTNERMHARTDKLMDTHTHAQRDYCVLIILCSALRLAYAVWVEAREYH